FPIEPTRPGCGGSELMDLTDIFDTRVGTLLGAALGVILVLNRPGGLRPIRWLYEVVNFVVNTVRSLPFIILMVAILPFTRVIVGSSIGTTAALVPLTIFIAPFMARLIEQSVLDVDSGILEA